MTPTEFDFTVQIPGDARLVGAIRQLTAHAAGYAQLTADVGEQLAAQVERATAAALTERENASTSIQYRFTADADAIVVVFSCQASSVMRHPAAVETDAVTVEWTTEGSRHVCRIRQRLPGA